MLEMFRRKTADRPPPGDAEHKPVPAQARRRHRLRNTAIGVGVFLVVFAVVGFFVVPPLAKHYAIRILSEQLGRAVSIKTVKVNPFAMTLQVGGVAVEEPAGSPTFLAFEALLVNVEYRSILRRAPVIKEITLRKPYVHIVRNADGRTYNFSDLIEKFARPKDDKSTAHYSVNNIRLIDGRIDFDDRPKKAQHRVSEINLAIPFISNLPDVVETYVEPAFSMKVNGGPIALTGRSKPFKDTLETSLDLNVDKLELPRYMEYVPVALGVKLPSGFLDAHVTLSFVRHMPQPQVLVKGSAALTRIALTTANDAPLLNFASLAIPITGIDVFGSRFEFGNVALAAPEAFVHRARDGSINWMAIKPAAGGPDTTAPQKDAAAGSAAPPLQISVAQFTLKDGKAHVVDEVPRQGFTTDLLDIQAAVKGIALPQRAPAQVDLAFSTVRDARVKLSAGLALEPLGSEGRLEIDRLPLKTYLPYFQDLILYRFEDGVASLSTGYSFKQTEQSPEVRLSAFNLGLDSIRLRKPGENEDFLRVRHSQIKDCEVDVSKLTLSVGEWEGRDAFINIIREADGGINATRILPAPAAAKTDKHQGTPWLINVGKASLERIKVAFTDLTLKEPVKIVADDLRLKATGLSNEKHRKGRVALQTRLNKTGSLSVSGPLSIDPVAADLRVDLRSFGLVPLQPYFTDKLNILMSSANLSVNGAAKLGIAAGGAVNAAFKGDIHVTDFASIEKGSAEDLLKWQSLHISGIDYNQAPMSVAVDEVALSQFYARLIIFPDGHLNLQDITVKEQVPAAETQQPAQPPPARGPENAARTAGRSTAPPQEAPKARADEATAQTAVQAAEAMPSVRIGKVSLQGGNVNFTDLFIKPNYSADLSEIGGAVVGLSSQLDTAADVDLSGRFASTAPVVIKGRINPLIRNLFLDIRAEVRDIELGPFSPYSGKYVGYAIEKGKMSFDVEYKVENRKLAAKNKLVLDQLTFGQKVESPSATKLPVLLAVALLKDRRGVIDVNLPISGSLDDPKFSVGGIVLRIIFNLIEKAVTAPFALIGNLLGGGAGEELAFIEFDYGRSVVNEAGRDKLAKLQRALVDRPGLKLDITPRSDPDNDREGLRQYRFEQQVKAQKLKDLVKQGETVASVDDVKVDPSEHEKYLKRAYKEARFPKPRNAIGITRDLPRAEMEKLMRANIQVRDDDLIKLANQRAQTVKDLITHDQNVALERVFLLAPRIAAAEADKKKGSRVDFSLK